MSNKHVPQHLWQTFVAWARQKRIKAPSSDEHMKALAQQFHIELLQRAQQIQYALKQFGEDPPQIVAHDRETNLLRDSGGMLDIVEPEYSDDDFAQTVRGKEAAMAEAGGDDLAAHVIYRDNVEVERNLEAKRNEALTVFSGAPPSWKGAQLGQIFSVQPAAVGVQATQPGPTQQAVNWSGELRETRECTVTASPVPAQRSVDGRLSVVSAGNGVSRPFLLVEWGTDQGFYHAQIDIGSGVKLTIACCALAVSIGLDAGSTAAMEVYGSMSYGAAPQPTPLTRTAYIDALGPAASSITFKPPFASQIVAVERSDFTVPLTLTYKDLAGNTVGQRTLAASTAIDAPLYLPNDAIEVDVTNTDGAKTTNVRLVYGLTL